MDKIDIKTPEELKIMQEGGKILSSIKQKLINAVKEGVSADDIETLANSLIDKSGGKASFKTVEGYNWATCVNVNSGIVHGIPHKSIVFKKGDVVSVDVGLLYKGFHTDTSITTAIEPNDEVKKFLKAGKDAFSAGVKATKIGGRIFDISEAIEDCLSLYGYTPIRDLVGHGVGRELHEGPAVPCFVAENRQSTDEIVPGMALAIEVMYTMGDYPVETLNDGWTIGTADGKISALFEDTVMVTQKGCKIITG